MPAIEVEELVVSYGDFDALRGLSFSVDPGEVVALLGPNGAGKTTAVETLEGFHRPRSGRALVHGIDPLTGHDELVGVLGVVLQNPGLYPMMTPARMLRLFASYYDRPRDPAELIKRLGLGRVADRRTKHLSGGERQRLALGLALVGRPRVAILDEPTAGVDPAGRVVVRELIAELRDDGVALLVTTHELAEAERLADRVVILREGRVLAMGRPESLAAARQEFSFTTSASLTLGPLAELLGATITEVRPGEYRVATTATPPLLAALTGWLATRDLALSDLRRSSLEDLYFSLLEGADTTKANEPDSRRRGRSSRAARNES